MLIRLICFNNLHKKAQLKTTFNLIIIVGRIVCISAYFVLKLD